MVTVLGENTRTTDRDPNLSVKIPYYFSHCFNVVQRAKSTVTWKYVTTCTDCTTMQKY